MGKGTRHIGFQIPMPDQTLSPEQFASRFESASRKFWCLAVGILGCQHQAEDVLQEAALTGLRRLDSFQAGTSFDAWMARIVRFTAFNAARRHYRKREIGVQESLAAGDPQPHHARILDGKGGLDPDQEHFDDSVVRALEQLGEMPRASFLLRTLMDLSYGEISDLLGIPEGTAMSQVCRARAALRGFLQADVASECYATWRAS